MDVLGLIFLSVGAFRPISHRPVTIVRQEKAEPRAILTMKPKGLTHRATMTTANRLSVPLLTVSGLVCASKLRRRDGVFPALGDSISKLSLGAQLSACAGQIPEVGSACSATLSSSNLLGPTAWFVLTLISPLNKSASLHSDAVNQTAITF